MASHIIKTYLHSNIHLISTVIRDVYLERTLSYGQQYAEHSGPIDNMGPSGMLMCHEQY